MLRALLKSCPQFKCVRQSLIRYLPLFMTSLSAQQELLSTHAADGDAPTSSSDSSQSDEQHWVVQDILAERTSVSGDNEVFVVWKASWIPVTNLQQTGAVLAAWRRTPKWISAAMQMRVMLAMEPGSQLEQDCERATAAAQHKPLRRRKQPHRPAAPGTKRSCTVNVEDRGQQQQPSSSAAQSEA